MKKDMPLEGLRWSRDSGSALYDTPQNGRSRTGWGGVNKEDIFRRVSYTNSKESLLFSILILSIVYFLFC